MTARIVTVTPNPALDMTWHAAAVVEGGSHRVDAAVVRAGGKGLNVARVLHAHGAPVLALTTTGGATGAEFAAELRASGIPHRLVPAATPTRRSVAIVDERLGDATVFNERGSDPGAEAWTALTDAAAAACSDAAVLVVSGSIPAGASADVVADLVALARERGLAVVVDTSHDALLAAADAGAAVLKPNRAELAAATGVDDVVTAARGLVARGAGIVLVSLGADGMVAVTADGEPRHARLPEALAGNPTGAGDAAVAAASLLLARGVTDLDELLRAAVAWSAAAVLEPVAGAVSPRHVEFAERVIVQPYPPENP